MTHSTKGWEMAEKPRELSGEVAEETFIGLSENEMRDLLDMGLGSTYQKAEASGLPASLTPFQQELIDAGRGAELIVGPYILESRIGSGGMGVVYKAQHLRMGRTVALKVLSTDLLTSEQAVARFLREVRALSKLRHPNIVTAFDAKLCAEEHYLAMELVEGSDLDQIVRTQGPFSIPEASEIIRQAAEALACVHQTGMVHRDIKPSNLMLDLTGQIKVTDFGLTKLGCAEQASGKEGLTRPGTILGSIDYLAPEQARDFSVATPAADIYSLGCTLGYLLAGTPPFKRSNIIETLTAHQTAKADALSSLRPDVPRALNKLYQEMLSKQPEKRPASMSEVAQRLSAFCATPKPQWFLKRRLHKNFALSRQAAIQTALVKAGDTAGNEPPSIRAIESQTISDQNARFRISDLEYNLPTYQEWLLLASVWVACMALSSG